MWNFIIILLISFISYNIAKAIKIIKNEKEIKNLKYYDKIKNDFPNFKAEMKKNFEKKREKINQDISKNLWSINPEIPNLINTKPLDYYKKIFEYEIKKPENEKIEETFQKPEEKIFQAKKEIKFAVNNILNKNELNFYNQLLNFVKWKNVFVFSKVRLADFINIDEKNITFWEKMWFFNKIKSKHIDFVITDQKSNIKYLIELDWYSHYKDYQTIKNDRFKEEIFKDLWLKLIRFKNKSFYNFDSLKI